MKQGPGVVVAVAALVVLAVVGVAAAWVTHPAWNQCASQVDGRLVEHSCDEAPR
ncbi:MAG: hypothetical protein ABF306_02400 [Nocardioides marinisabuli]|uniref:hypothetical protein n=1 Tax=Nocardioides marinisabuli TaxID=419476 RepID=UPI003219CD00